MFRPKFYFSSKINLNLITRDVFDINLTNFMQIGKDFEILFYSGAIFDFFEGTCTKNQKFSPNEELEC